MKFMNLVCIIRGICNIFEKIIGFLLVENEFFFLCNIVVNVVGECLIYMSVEGNIVLLRI